MADSVFLLAGVVPILIVAVRSLKKRAAPRMADATCWRSQVASSRLL